MSGNSLYERINHTFNKSELRTLCFELGIDSEELLDEWRKSDFVRELILYCQRRNHLAALVQRCQQLRPNETWPPPQDLILHLFELPLSLKTYLEALARTTAVLPLAPLDPSRDRVAISLGQVFINLDAATAETTAPGPQPGSFIHQRYSAALAHIHHHPHLILLGDPGSGKSTLLRFLAHCLAQHATAPTADWLPHLHWTCQQMKNRQVDPRAAWAEVERDEDKKKKVVSQVTAHWSNGAPLPLLVELRNFARTPFDPDSSLALWQFVAQNLAKEGFTEAVQPLKELAQQGQVLFLLDGVDEVPAAQRKAIWQAIASLDKGPFGGNRWLATCRILSFDSTEAPPDVPVQTLQKLTEAQIDGFIQNWYTVLTDELGSDKAKTMTHSLQQATRRHRLLPLAQNPMLLTIMAIVQTYHGTLPDERAKLYQNCVETLLYRWQKHKDVNVFDELQTNKENLERLLWEVAWKAHSEAPTREEAADIPEADVIQTARQHLGSYAVAEKFLEYTERRAHLLVGYGGGTSRVYRFPHRTFQEYLAACHLAASRRFPQEAAKLAAEGDTWREVLNLAMGVLVYNQNNREKALDGIQGVLPARTPQPDQETGWCRVWLAGEMMTVVGAEAAEKDEVGQKLLPKLQKQLAALLDGGRLTPRQRAEAGDALGLLGDSRPGVCTWLPEMVPVAAGPFLMGSDKKQDKQAYDTETPQHTVDLPVYAIGKYAVTVAQFACFVQDGGYTDKWRHCWTAEGWNYCQKEGWQAPRYWDDPQMSIPNRPVVGVSWYEVVAYCAWLKAKTGRNFRLPSEAMWEKAARGTEGNIYPWGNQWNPLNLNANETGINRTSAVGMFPDGKSPYDVWDASGNVFEWCSTVWGNYPFQAKVYEEELQAKDTRIWRGGAFVPIQQRTRTAYRYYYLPYVRNHWLGFRVAEHLSGS